MFVLKGHCKWVIHITTFKLLQIRIYNVHIGSLCSHSSDWDFEETLL